MSGIRLSICIATYNRAQFIGETISSILPQLREDVELVIVDGASTDNTAEIIARFIPKSPQIRYFLLPCKGGVDQDFCKAVELARGDACWLFSDDDILFPDAVGTILSELEKGYSLLVVNTQVKSLDLTQVMEERILKLDKDEILDGRNLDQLFRLAANFMSFIGCIVINRKLWLSREKEKYFGSEFIHIGIIFQDYLPGKMLVMSEPKIIMRYGNVQWRDRSFEIWMCKWPRLLCSFATLSKDVTSDHQPDRYWHRLKGIVLLRAKRRFSIHEYRTWIAPSPDPTWWKMLVLIMAHFPVGLVNAFLIPYYTVFRSGEKRTIHDLNDA